MKEFIWKFKFIILGVAVLTSFLIGGTYAWVNIEIIGEKTNKIIAGSLELTLNEDSCTEINLVNASPISDNKGMENVACTFTLSNTGSHDSEYSLLLNDLEIEESQTRMDDKFIKYSLVKNSVNEIDLLSNTGVNPNRVLDKGMIKIGDSITYELRLWIDYDATNEAMNKVLKTNLKIVANSVDPNKASGDYNDTSGANVPEIVGDMIPVIYDEVNSVWVKAGAGNWYNYDEQEWANAVTVTETNRETLVSADAGTTISMDDINTFMVWIPRYSYTIRDTYGYQGYGGDTPSLETPGAFDIKFIESTTTDMGSAEYTGDNAENWFTNSAFCWGNSCDDESTRKIGENRELSGIWIAKFETSDSGSSTPNSLPNVTSWRSINVSTMFNTVQTNMNVSTGTNTYGLSGSTYDAHMMKNTEWGAVAYLTQSRYGKYGNEDYSGANKEIYQNKNSSNTTGNSNGTPSQSTTLTQCTYDNIEDRGNGTGSCGGGASTTGNITGIYDMSGGANEYVMENMQDSSGNFYPSLSGFSAAPEAKYYNNYVNGSSSSDYTRYIKGDATKEMAGFYSDYKYFIYGSYPWFYRGGHYGNNFNAGLADFSISNGNSSDTVGFRLALAP